MAKRVWELIGTELDYWAGRAAGFSEREICIELRPLDAKPHAVLYADGATKYGHPFCGNKGHGAVGWQPSTDWAQGGPIIERENIAVIPACSGGGWYGQMMVGKPYFAESCLVAAMRCYVVSKFGEEIKEEE